MGEREQRSEGRTSDGEAIEKGSSSKKRIEREIAFSHDNDKCVKNRRSVKVW